MGSQGAATSRLEENQPGFFNFKGENTRGEGHTIRSDTALDSATLPFWPALPRPAYGPSW